MLGLFKKQLEIFRRCKGTLIKKEIAFKIILMAVGYPLFLLIINATMHFSGVQYITNEIALNYIKHPITIIGILLIFLAIGLCSMYELSIITTYYDACDGQKEENQWGIFSCINKRFLSLFNRKQIGIIIYSAIAIPSASVTNLVMYYMASSVIKKLLKTSERTMLILLGIMAVLFLVSIFFMVTSMVLVRENASFGQSAKRSVRLVAPHFFKVLVYFLIWNLIMLALVMIVYLLYSFLVVVGVYLLKKHSTGIAIYLSMLRWLSSGLFLVMLLVFVPLTLMVIMAVYNYCKEKQGEDYNLEELQISKNREHMGKTVAYGIILIICAFLDVIYVRDTVLGNTFSDVEFANVPNITAHRGSSSQAPENTMSAFKLAINEMADYIELDVKQTSDGVVICIHDASLKRTTGVNKDVWKVNYDYITTLEAGSWFDEIYAGEPIPTLEDVIVACKGKIKLNIEIKPTGHDINLEEAVVELIEKYDMEGQCVVTSMKYEVLKKVKHYNSNITTGYVMSAAYGKFYEMEYADFFSVNYSFVTKKLVDLIHNNNKTIHVWTVNGYDDIQRMVKMGVDNIITDNPVTCREIVYSKYSNEKIVDILRYVFE